MKNTKITKLAGIVLGISVLLSVPVQNASAGIYRGHSRSSWGQHRNGHGGQYRRHRRNKRHYGHGRSRGYVGPYKHAHDYEFFGFSYGLPFGAKKIKVNGNAYHHYNGTFYKRCNKRGYDIVRAPYGTFLPHLPSGHGTRYRKGKKYWYHNHTYYKKAPGGYVVVEGPDFGIAYRDNDYYFHYSTSKY